MVDFGENFNHEDFYTSWLVIPSFYPSTVLHLSETSSSTFSSFPCFYSSEFCQVTHERFSYLLVVSGFLPLVVLVWHFSPFGLRPFSFCCKWTRETGYEKQAASTSAKLTFLSVYDDRDVVSEHTSSPSSPSSITHVHRCIGSHNTTRQKWNRKCPNMAETRRIALRN